jgi:hypothetical protein
MLIILVVCFCNVWLRAYGTLHNATWGLQTYCSYGTVDVLNRIVYKILLQ